MIDVLICAKETFNLKVFLKFFEKQTFKDFRLLLLSSEKNINKFDSNEFRFPFIPLKEKNIIWESNIENMRQSAARNELLHYAIGPYVLFFDAYQIPSDNLIEEHIKWLSKGYNVCGQRIDCKNKYNEYKENDSLLIYKEDDRNSGFLRECSASFFWTCNASTSLEKMKEINGFDLRYCGGSGGEDVDAGARLGKIGERFVFNPKALMYHLDHDSIKLKEQHPHDTCPFRDSDLMENQILKCWHDKYNLKRWTCKFCGSSGLIDSSHLLLWNERNNIIRVPEGLKETNRILENR